MVTEEFVLLVFTFLFRLWRGRCYYLEGVREDRGFPVQIAKVINTLPAPLLIPPTLGNALLLTFANPLSAVMWVWVYVRVCICVCVRVY